MWAYTNNGIHSLSSDSSRSAGTGIPSVIVRLLSHANPLRLVSNWWHREETLNELYGLDHRTLADLGITRGDFPAIVSGKYHRGE